jgi:hypothetical protein
MNTADTFIEQLSHHLKQFSGVQRQDILDEIASHFEAGQNDPQLGSTPEERKTNLMNEMGSPSELGQGLRNVYRPNRLVDFLLVFIPVYLLFPLVVPLLLLSGKTQIKWEHPATIYIYFPLLFGMGMVLLSAWRRSTLLLAFWIPDALCRLISLMFNQQRWTNWSDVPSNLVWYTVLLGLVYVMGRFLYKNRSDPLVILFAALPLFQTAFNVITIGILGGVPAYASWQVLGFGLPSVLGLVSLSGWFLLEKRLYRWVALLLGAVSFAIFMMVSAWPNLAVAALWATLPAAYLHGLYTDLRPLLKPARSS